MSGNVANLQALSIEVGNAETELTFAQAQVQSEIFSVLTAEQKQKIAERAEADGGTAAGDDETEARAGAVKEPGGSGFRVPVLGSGSGYWC